MFRAVREDRPSHGLGARFHEFWPGYRRWFLREGERARPPYLECERALKRFMPELTSTFEELLAVTSGGDLEARFLSLYCPTPYLTACSQAAWLRGDGPALVRNYDYKPSLWEGVLVHTEWNGQRVMAMSDCVWGVLDGVNESGLAVSLAFGGRKVVGDGFGIPVVLRYVLEFCETTADAVAVLRRVPSHMAYNVTVVDRHANARTVHLGPDRVPEVTRQPVSTNHQQWIEWSEFAEATGSVERERFLNERLNDRREDLRGFVERFLAPPLYSARFGHGWGTLYTAEYIPAAGQARIHWPGRTVTQSFGDFQPLEVGLSYKESDQNARPTQHGIAE